TRETHIARGVRTANLPCRRCLLPHWKRNPLPRSQPMNDHTSQARQTVTLFATDASANGAASADRQRVEHLAGQLGLAPAQVSAVHAVITWAVFLRPSTDCGDREHLR